MRDVGRVIDDSFKGRFGNVLRESGGSAVKMVDILVKWFNNFRDHNAESGLYFYKRA